MGIGFELQDALLNEAHSSLETNSNEQTGFESIGNHDFQIGKENLQNHGIGLKRNIIPRLQGFRMGSE